MREFSEPKLVARRSAIVPVAVFAVLKLAFHTVVNRQYGFHRDELATLDDARHLAWGYVAYPPLTPFLGRVALTLFGESLAGFRFFAAAAMAVAMVLAADMARRMGGDRTAQAITAVAVAIAPVSLAASSLFQYVAFDYLWWVVICWSLIARVESGNRRWWLMTGAAIGLGVLTKYAIAFCVVGVLIALLMPPLLQDLRSRWPWLGAVIATLIAAPNLIWQSRHGFVTLEFLRSIHERDIAIGRTSDFLVNQLYVPAHLLTIPLWLIGLVALIASRHLRPFRFIAVIAAAAFGLFVVAKGRDYYTAPLYPMLLAAGSVWLFESLKTRPRVARAVAPALMVVLSLGGAVAAAMIVPIAPVGSKWWRRALQENGDLREEFGWPALAQEVARIWQTIPPRDRLHAAIYCANYGEAGAIDLYGPRHGLPPAISGVNSFWARGYGDPPPTIVIVLGGHRDRLEKRYLSVERVGQFPNPLAIDNEEAGHPDIFLCRGPRESWAVLWPQLRGFG
jgi:4-amino-4-deoxy-L-arabinose transferase-like glycosyltransferase